MRLLVTFLLSFCFLAWSATPADAHPHAWISVNTTVLVNEKGEATAIRERWLFDKMYSVYALDDFDPNKNGKIDPDELLQLANENLSNLKAYNYFTVFEGSDGKAVALGNFKDVNSFLEKKDSGAKPAAKKKNSKETITRLPDGTTRITTQIVIDPQEIYTDASQIVMEFTAPLSVPQSLYGKGASYRIYDPTYYTDIGHIRKAPVKFVSDKDGKELTGCRYDVSLPKVDQNMIFSAAAIDKNGSAPKELGYYFSEKVTLACSQPK